MSRFKKLFYLRRRTPDAAEAELRDELASHVALAVDELVAQGVPHREALARARSRFGDFDSAAATLADAARAREMRSARRDHLGGIAQDVRFAFVQLRRAPGYAAAVVLTLALGIGATTATLALVREVLWRELPFAQPERLVRVWAANPAGGHERAAFSVPDVDDWRTSATTIERAGAFSTMPGGLLLTGNGEPEQLRTAYVGDGFFETLGVGARIGRTPTPDEYKDGSDRVVVLSDRTWRTRFGADPTIVGRAIRLRDEPFTVVGVMPPTMRYPEDVELWAPRTLISETGIPRTRGVRWLELVARVRPGTSLERAQADFAAVARRVAAADPGPLAGWTDARVQPLAESIHGGVRARLLLVLGAVALVLLLGCVNVAGLALVRATGRAREMAVRAALGAGRGRLARQLLVEQVVLALAGGALGVAIAWWGGDALVRATARWMPPVGPVRPDPAMLGVALALSLVTGILTGLLPALRQQADAGSMLRTGARGAGTGGSVHALRGVLVAAEVALAVTLVAGAALLGRSFARLNAVELGFEPERVLLVKAGMKTTRFPDGPAYQFAIDQVLARVAALPGVTHVAVAKDAPLRGAAGEESAFTLPGEQGGDLQRTANFLPVSPGWFATMGVPLRAGRDLRDPEDSLTGGVVVSEALARATWPGRSALGQQLAFAGGNLTVVGVAADVRWTRVDSVPPPMVYLSRRIMRRSGSSFVVRTAGDPAAMIPAVRAAIREVNPDQAFQFSGTMRDVVAEATAAPRFLMVVVTAFGALALLLAAIGVYGVVAYLVGQRTRDIGVRVALGADARAIAAWTLRSAMGPVVLGVGVGVVAALLLSRAIRGQLFEVSPNDPTTLAAVVLTVVLVSLVATAVPARRAMRIDPAEALRRE